MVPVTTFSMIESPRISNRVTDAAATFVPWLVIVARKYVGLPEIKVPLIDSCVTTRSGNCNGFGTGIGLGPGRRRVATLGILRLIYCYLGPACSPPTPPDLW